MISLSKLPPFAYWYFVFFAAVIGLCIGSFSNVVILRGLSGESIVMPPSKCPKCSNKLKWYDNIPIFSYLFLLGKCRYCKAPISVQYPIVEAVCGLLYVFIFLKYEFSLTTIFMWAVVTLFLIMTVTDLKEQVIIDKHAFVLIGLSILYNFLHKEFLLPILGIIVGVTVMEALAMLGKSLFSRRAFGEGDSYIAAAIGALIGWKFFLFSLVLAILIQTFIILPVFIFNLIKEKKYILLFSLTGFMTFAIILYIFKNMNLWLYLLFFILLLVFAFIVIKQIFKTAKQADLHSIPFGPAMLISAFLFIIWGKYLSAFIGNLI